MLTLAVVLLAVDGTVLALAVPALTADLAPTATQLLWIGDIYSFALAGLLVTMGNVADRIGRKKLDRVDLTENRPGKLLRGYVRAMCEPTEAISSAFAATGLALVLRGVSGVAEVFAADEARWRADLAADGIPLERVLVVRYGAEGVASALNTWMMDADDLARVRAELLALAEPG